MNARSTSAEAHTWQLASTIAGAAFCFKRPTKVLSARLALVAACCTLHHNTAGEHAASMQLIPLPYFVKLQVNVMITCQGARQLSDGRTDTFLCTQDEAALST